MATVVEWDRDFGLVRHQGELWSAAGAGPFRPKDQARIVRAEGTLLLVQPEDAGTASRPARA